MSKKSLRKFAITMGIAFFAIAAFIIIRHRRFTPSALIISLLFFIFAFINPNLLKPLYILWMRFAFVLGWFNTRLILFVIFYLFLTPIGIGMKLFGVDLLDRKIEKNKITYWKKKERRTFRPLDYESQF